MPVQVNLPPGNSQVRMYDGTVYKAGRPGGRITVDNAEHAKAIDAMGGNGTAGLLNASGAVYGAVRKPGRICTRCGFHAYPWSLECPRPGCGAPTEPEPARAATRP
jgi:hypothetical protein